MTRGQFRWPRSFTAANNRRCDLIEMGCSGWDPRHELDPEKRKLAQEFKMLQAMVGAFVDGCHPPNFDFLKEIDEALRSLTDP